MSRPTLFISGKVNETIKIQHPLHEELSFLYGVIFTDDTNLKLTSQNSIRTSVNVTIFAEGQVSVNQGNVSKRL